MSITPIDDLWGQNYDSMWKQVATDQEKDLPKQTIKDAEKIFKRASREQNYPQLMKSWITIIETKSDLDPDSFKVADFPPIAHEGPVQSAIYNAIMGSAYLIMRDTNISEDDADTQEDYTARAKACFTSALSDKEALANESAENYRPLVTSGDDSRFYHHDLLSLLTRFIDDHSEMTNGEKAQLYSDLADFYLQRNNREAYTLMTLQELTYQSCHEDYNLRLSDSSYRSALKQLVDESKDLETGSDVASQYIDKITDNDERIDFARWAQKQYAPISRIQKFKSIEQQILQPSVNFRFEGNCLANQPIPVTLVANNCISGELEVRQYNGRNKKNELKTDGTLVLHRGYHFCQDATNTERRAQGYYTTDTLTDSITLPAGHYVYVVNGAGDRDVSEVSITSLRLLSFSLPGQKHLLQVVDNETGRPVPNAIITISDHSYYGQKEEDVIYHTDDKGEVLIDDKNNRALYASASILNANDQTDPISLYGWESSRTQKATVQGYLFTDREIYRPSQAIHVYGLVYRQKGDSVTVEPDYAQKISLRDANHRVVAEQTVKTNSLGSFDLDFVIPQDIILGSGTIESNRETRSIRLRIEEYKRPTFTVETQKSQTALGAQSSAFALGDTIQVEAIAKTFSGVPVQGAKVHYKIESAEVSFWRWFDCDWDVLAQGDTLTDNDGKSIVDLFLDPKHLYDQDRGVVRYRVSIDVTDQAGETQGSSFSISVSSHSFGLQIESSDVNDLAKQGNTFSICALNANHEPVSVSGTYSLYNIGKEGTKNPILEETNQASQKCRFTSNERIPLPDNLVPGSYRIHASALDNDGTEITVESVIQVFDSRKAKNLSTPGKAKDPDTFFSSDFIYQPQEIFSEQEPASVFFSPCQEDVNLGYMILSNDELIERHQVTVTRQQYKLSIPYESRYGDGISILFWYVRNGHLLFKQVEFHYQEPEKKLFLLWSTFRDKLYPGQQEVWTLNVRDKEGKPVNGAELLTSMYDASLDQLAPHNWHFGLSFSRQIRRWRGESSDGNKGYSLQCVTYARNKDNDPRQFDELTEYIHDRWARPYFHRSRFPMMMANRSMALCDIANDEVVEAEAPNTVFEAKMVAADSSASIEEVMVSSAPIEVSEPLRTNFAETAFFYPHLLTDGQGNAKISFTLPESLTQWKFMGFAHTQQMDYGFITDTIVARKDFMVQPNMPRFVREGDQAIITARIISTCERDLCGTAQMRLIDPTTDQTVAFVQQPFSIQAGQTTSVSFQANITDQYPMLVCEVIGVTDNVSDGERNYLPVLSSKKYITEAIPFYITGSESQKDVDISTLFNNGSSTATHRRLMLEYTAQPVWTVIEALDGIKVPENDCAPCFAASLYANVIASRLAQGITGFHEALVYTKSHNVTAKSQLDENQDFKDIVLNESPWLRDALAEADQRNRLLDLFDEGLMSQRILTARAKLELLQNPDGSWSWFQGMQGSYYITLSVCQNLALLHSDDERDQQMLTQGLAYLDARELEHYQRCLEHKQPLYASESTLQYLYICSFQPSREVSKPLLKMREAYLKLIEHNVRDLTIQGRSYAACMLRAFGHTRAANDFLESAVQYTVTKPGMGRFYATDAAYYSWCDYRIPTQLAAMRALHLSERTDRDSLLNDMQLWLLRQKQAQMWDSPINTIGAVNEMMSRISLQKTVVQGEQTGSMANDSIVSFSIDGTAIPSAIDTTRFLAPQLGYIRTNIDEAIASHPLQVLKVSAPSMQAASAGSLSYGSLFAHYLEDMDRLSTQATGELKVSIRLISDQATQPSDHVTLHVGDKVTLRVIVSVDRDMDFVQVRMQRPACFEPINQHSGYCWMNGRGGYVSMHDASTDLFFDTFKRGTMTYDIPFVVDRTGQYLSGVTTAQCAYAPDFSAHTGAILIVVE